MNFAKKKKIEVELVTIFLKLFKKIFFQGNFQTLYEASISDTKARKLHVNILDKDGYRSPQQAISKPNLAAH